MKKILVVFASKYGTTRRYAQWIAEALSCPLLESSKVRPQDLAQTDILIYGGGLYAGGVSGINLLTKNSSLLSGKEVFLFTCGISDPAVPSNVAHIREALSKTLPPELFAQIHLFHFRGGIDYSKLNFIHRAMMSMLRKGLQSKSEADLSADDRQLLETYGKVVDFTDRESISPLVEEVRSLSQTQQ